MADAGRHGRILQRDDEQGLDRAIADFGPGDWIDLSTGLNRHRWPVKLLPPQSAASATAALRRAAAQWLDCDPAQVLPVADPWSAVLRLPPGQAAILGSSRAEERLHAAGWALRPALAPLDLAGADLVVVANPAGSEGREWQPGALAELAGNVPRLVVDESLVDPRPDLSLAPMLPANALVLRELQPFWGLVGLGLVLGDPALLPDIADPCPVQGCILGQAAAALADRRWAEDMVLYLTEASLRLDRIAAAAGWRMAGGTHLFRLYDTGDARAAQDRLARAYLWTRRAAGGDRLLRMDIPQRREWDRVSAAMREI
jgi:cobalamin biosynthesis protein CobC